MVLVGDLSARHAERLCGSATCTKQVQVMGATFTSATQMGVAAAFITCVVCCVFVLVKSAQRTRSA